MVGNKQKYNINYQETFAQVAKMAMVSTVLAIVPIKKWHMPQMDVTNAFLHGNLVEEVDMTLPLGYTRVGSRTQPIALCALSDRGSKTDRTTKVCKLLKSLYGLK